MTFIYLLIPLFVGFLPIGFSRIIESGPHSGGLITSIIVLVMLWDVMHKAIEDQKIFKTIITMSGLLMVANIIILVLEASVNAILSDSLYRTFYLEDFTTTTPSYLGLAMPFIYIIPRALITFVACKIYKGNTMNNN